MRSRDQQSQKRASRLVPKPNGKDDRYGSRVYVAKANSGRELVLISQALVEDVIETIFAS